MGDVAFERRRIHALGIVNILDYVGTKLRVVSSDASEMEIAQLLGAIEHVVRAKRRLLSTYHIRTREKNVGETET